DAAGDAAEARNRLAEKEYALVLTDINMPGESGTDFARFVRNRYPDTAIVVNTVIDNPVKAGEILGIGIYGYIVKPFERIHVLVNVANALARRRLEKDQAGYRDTLEKTVQERTFELTRMIRSLEEAKAASEDLKSRYQDQLVFLQTLIDAIPEPIFFKDTEGKYRGCNTAFSEFIGQTRETIIGKTVYEVAPRELADVYHEEDLKLFHEKCRQAYEARVADAKGVFHDIHFSKAVFRSTGGGVAGLVGIMLDVTERKRAEMELREAEGRFRGLVEGSTMGIMIHCDMRPVFVNQAYLDLHGYTKDEFFSLETISPLIAPEEHDRLVGYFQARQSGDWAPIRYEYRGKRKDGSIIWLECRVMKLRWDGQDAVQFTVSDITKRKRSETALRENETMLNTILESVMTGVVVVDEASHIIVNINAYAARLVGRSRKDVIGQICHESICPDKNGACSLLYKAKTVEKVETNLQTADDRSLPVLKTIKKIKINGRLYLICSFVDISERKECELKIQQNHREMEALFSGITSILIGITGDGRVIQWNEAAERILGLAADTVLGFSLRSSGIQWEWDRIEEGLSSCRKRGQTVSLVDVRFTGADGKNGFLDLRISTFAGGVAGETGVLIMGNDITERKRLEDQLAQAQKLESIGQLAAGIAHEINTPTQYVGDNTRFLQGAFNDLLRLLEPVRGLLAAVKNGLPPDDPARKLETLIEDLDVSYLEGEIPGAIEQTLEGVDRISTIVRSMKEFSHPGSEVKTAVDINRALESTSVVARNEWKYVADLVMNLEPNLPPVWCLPGELNQVFLNLIINAAHAIAEADGSRGGAKGTITIRTRSKEDRVEIRIEDTGCGIPLNIRHRIFDPFFTTKPVGKGTGQGLAIAHSVVCEKHGGSLSFETKEGTGTAFIIQMPVSDPVA
ncbi:MAG: PAS domain S-box protein, partial [Acidobacteria bacterium]|nr:PAS domain S-box protein [Acidobacteriota bacterium]